MITAALAKYLDAEVDGLTFSETATTSNVFVEHEPDTPDEAVTVRSSSGLDQLTKSPTDRPLVQLIIRGPRLDNDDDAVRTGHATWEACYEALNCLDQTTLDADGTDEVHVVMCTAAQSAPIWLGLDANRRPRWSLNLRLRTHNPTLHRS